MSLVVDDAVAVILAPRVLDATLPVVITTATRLWRKLSPPFRGLLDMISIHSAWIALRLSATFQPRPQPGLGNRAFALLPEIKKKNMSSCYKQQILSHFAFPKIVQQVTIILPPPSRKYQLVAAVLPALREGLNEVDTENLVRELNCLINSESAEVWALDHRITWVRPVLWRWKSAPIDHTFSSKSLQLASNRYLSSYGLTVQCPNANDFILESCFCRWRMGVQTHQPHCSQRNASLARPIPGTRLRRGPGGLARARLRYFVCFPKQRIERRGTTDAVGL